jgi:hypothetical protein
VAEAVRDYDSSRPIVFGILPHPARPLPDEYRLYDRVSPETDDKACSIYDAFRPWPQDPRPGMMKLYPKSDPKAPGEGASWEYAESCRPFIKSAKPTGYRTMYLSRKWFGCRAGRYDGWEWRSGATGGTSLTPHFIDYLCWEVKEWIGRYIFDAIYLDECYEEPARNLEAGFSVRLPDGTEQPGLSNFQFRELMKRWRTLFAEHGKTPMLIGHHTHSWQYHGLVFCDSTLDGENAPIVSVNSRDWIDSTSKVRFEAIQNARLWGISTFYMPFISEGGFGDKGRSQFPVWQWRMARQAQSMFAHYETATVYEGQGAHVYKSYWRDVLDWGAGRPEVRFHPYWEEGSAVRVPGGGDNLLASYYRDAEGKRSLVIVSNRARKPADAVLELDLAALTGKAGAEVKVRDVDSTLKTPPGDDFLSRADTLKEAQKASNDTLDALDSGGELDDLLGDELAGLGEESPEEKLTAPPSLEGNRLKFSIRPRDYRVFSLE